MPLDVISYSLAKNIKQIDKNLDGTVEEDSIPRPLGRIGDSGEVIAFWLYPLCIETVSTTSTTWVPVVDRIYTYFALPSNADTIPNRLTNATLDYIWIVVFSRESFQKVGFRLYNVPEDKEVRSFTLSGGYAEVRYVNALRVNFDPSSEHRIDFYTGNSTYAVRHHASYILVVAKLP